MTINKKISNLPAVLLIALFCLAVLIIYQLVILLSKIFVYLGFNLFLFTDSLLKFESTSPLLLWGLFGLFIGSIFGVIIAVKKYRLSKLLILYPVSLTLLIIIIFYFLNQAAMPQSAAMAPANTEEAGTSQPQQNNITYYTVTQTVYARSLPSLRSERLFSLTRGARVEVIENTTDDKNNAWTKVGYTNPQTGYKKTGYINSRYLKKAE